MSDVQKYRTWVKYSEKGYDFKRLGLPENQPLNEVKPVTRGRVVCNSGHLVFCESLAVKSILYGTSTMWDEQRAKASGPVFREGDGPFYINYTSLPNLMQFNDDAVNFSNLFGDGMFAVLSNKGDNLEVYAETYPTDLSPKLTKAIMKGQVRERIDGRNYRLEGLVGLGSGRMAVVDPELYEVVKTKEASKFFELFTVVKVPKGVYVCEFVDKGEENSKVSLRRAS